MKIKHVSTGVAVLALSFIAACNKQPAQQACQVGSETTLTVKSSSGEISKTWMDDSAPGTTIPVYWSDGDKIAVNGIASSPLSIGEGAKVSSAQFKVRNVSAPYSVIYPAEDLTSYDSGNYIIDIPASQQYVPGSFSCGSAILYGYGENADQPVQLNNLCGAIKVTFTQQGETPSVIKSLTLTSRGGQPLAGQFSLNPKDGTFSVVEGSGLSTLSLALPSEGVTLTKEGTPFIITIPQGDYPEGFTLKFIDANKHVLRNYWLRMAEGEKDSVTVAAGKIVKFDARAFVPDAREITSASDWEEFAVAYNADAEAWKSEWLGKNGTIRISEDFSAATLTQISTLRDTIVADGHTVTISEATAPLFNVISGGRVKGLTLDGSLTTAAASAAVPMAAVLTADGAIENCTNKMAIVVSGSTDATYAASFVKTLSGGTVRNCTNEGDIFVQADMEAESFPVVAGGIVATVDSEDPSFLDNACYIEGCNNKGAVKVDIIRTAGCANAPLFSGYGGIVGTVLKGDSDKFLTMSNCTNNKNVSVSCSTVSTCDKGMETLSGVGGIAGTIIKFNPNGKTMAFAGSGYPDCVYMLMDSCVNNGDISNDLVSSVASNLPNKSFAGGIVGIVNGMRDPRIIIRSSKNYGKVIGHEGGYSRSALCSVTGGLAGFGAYVNFENCVVKSAQIGSQKRQQYSSSGGIGYVLASFSLKKCRIFADVYQFNYYISDKTQVSYNYSQGFTLNTNVTTYGGLSVGYVKLYGSKIIENAFGGVFHYNSTPIPHNGAAVKLDKQETITASTVQDKDKGVIASRSFYNDGNGKGWCKDPATLTISGDNTYWDGKE